MFSTSRSAVALLTLVPLVSLLLPGARAATDTCNATSLCGAESPCCSPYGYCGTGADFCFGGCDPVASHTLDSCMPEPICQSTNITFANFDRILMNQSAYNGNASMYDFILDQGNIQNSSASELVLLLTEENNGTRLSSTRYVHYGQITARLKTGRWGGVVTAFITMSDVKDEIDWEFPGNQTTEGQTNYFWQGFVPTQTAGQTTGNLTDTFSNYHDYTIDWQEDQLQWLIDGNVVRTLTRESVTNNSTDVHYYPSTPSRIEISLWPAGISSEPTGTVEWAGGMIDWNDSDYKAAGHFYASFEWIAITCNDSSTVNSNITSYVYGSNSSAYTPNILYTNETTIESSGAWGMSATRSGAAMWSLLACAVAMLLGSGLF
ncbi:glycoside hydrolase family 16 protein [Laetiporus sulphureus 93-53]|uniref:Glycoside hydrolase family 16 protein n=1 Tax=Laetiporus sulphureus 93-53 TaxID=1314785 RepID=A0A165BK82_9APHY|nr:glycoside hydrolase family 16 protein [Laetiporus sulphureus 93-53]KZT01211.1 glycoside hydrolase family 16 protein [Laetiporus sulphureus 93-53]